MRVDLNNIKVLALRGRYFLLATVFTIAAILGNISLPGSAHAAVGTIAEFAIPNSPFYPRDLTVGPDNKIWHTGYQRIGAVTTTGSFTQHSRFSGYHYGITTGADGNLWYGEEYTVASIKYGRIVNMTPSGTVVGQYDLPNNQYKNAMKMTLGPDGAVWFTESVGNQIGRITTSGEITEYLSGGSTTDITTGPDGNLWVTNAAPGSYGNYIAKITTSGTRTVYSIPTYSAEPQSITTGPDGNLWFTEKGANKIGKITTSGVMTEYDLPTANSQPYGITIGSDGALWFTAGNTGKIGRITTTGVVTAEYSVSGTPAGSLRDIITGPDGAVWYISYFTHKVGRVTTELSNQTISFTSATPGNAVIDGPTYSPTASATSGLPVTITVDASSSSVCSIDGSGVVTFPGYGTCVLNANQAGNVDYSAAPQVQQSFSVRPVNADTSVSLSCPASAGVSTTVTCTITVANDGPAASDNASLTALFSSLLSDASLSGGGTLSGQYITWSVPSLASGASTTITFNATASEAGKARLNAAMLQTSPDPNMSNNIVDSMIVIN